MFLLRFGLVAIFIFCSMPSIQSQDLSTADINKNLGTTICRLTPSDLDRSLGMDFVAFDQQMGGGWRSLAHHGCGLTAAMLLDVYNNDSPNRLNSSQREMISFHAGQLYAFSGLPELAVRRIYASLDLHEKSDAVILWNPYALGTIAFLQRDKAGLNAQRDRLAAAVSSEGNKLNLAVLTRLANCFDGKYSEAYERCDLHDSR